MKHGQPLAQKNVPLMVVFQETLCVQWLLELSLQSPMQFLVRIKHNLTIEDLSLILLTILGYPILATGGVDSADVALQFLHAGK